MTRKFLFDVVTIGSFALPLSLALILVVLPHPKSPVGRAVVAVVAAWVVSVVYTIYLYNPAGIAAGHELGWDSPEMRFDNSTVASQLLGGWVYPSITVALFFAVRHVWPRRERKVASDHAALRQLAHEVLKSLARARIKLM